MASDCHDAQFVDIHRAALIQGVTTVLELADKLLSKGMLRQEIYEGIRDRQITRQEQTRRLLDAVAGVPQKKSYLHQLLKEYEPHLLSELEDIIATPKKRPMSPTSSEKEKKRTRCLGESIARYKETLHMDYKTFQEYNSLPGEEELLADRYTKLLIVQKHRKQEEKEEELRSRGQKHSDVLSSRCSKDESNTSIEQLFHPDQRGGIPKAVILQGDSGHGKSFTMQKIVHDWACGNLYQDQFELVLLLKCKELNCLSGNKSMVQLLNCDSEFTPMIEEILTDAPEKVLFIMDGFDELKFSLEDTNYPCDAFTTASIEATLSALLKGRILSQSFLLVTTRSTASDKLSKQLRRPQQFTEILGFSGEAMMEYFQRFFKDTQTSEEAYKYMTNDIMLSTVCSIPVICWVVCTTLKEHFEDGKDNMKGLETTTSIYLHFVSLLQKHHCTNLHKPVITLLRNLAKLAENGILKKQVFFEEECVLKATSDPTSIPFLNKFLRKKKTEVNTTYSFLHLSFQEFFSALHYVITDNERDKKKLKNRLPYPDHKFTDNPELLKKSYMYYRDFLRVVEFLCGLSNEKEANFIKQQFNISVSPAIRICLEEWILQVIGHLHSNTTDFNIFILGCLYELHDEQFVQKAMESWGSIDVSEWFLSDMSCWSLKYCIGCSQSIRHLNISIRCIEHLNLLQPELDHCENLSLETHNLQDTDVEDLITILGSRRAVTTLEMIQSKLSEQSLLQVITHVGSRHSLPRISTKTITSSVVAAASQYAQNKLEFCDRDKLQPFFSISLIEISCCDEDASCSSLSITANNEGLRYTITSGKLRYSLTPRQQYFSTVWECGTSQESDPGLSVSLSQYTDTSSTDWMDLMQRFHSLKSLNQSSPELTTKMDGLLLSLSATPHLTRIHLQVNYLDMTWAAWTLSLHHLQQSCPGLTGISVVEQTCGNDKSVCSYISVCKPTTKNYKFTFMNSKKEELFDQGSTKLPEPCLVGITLTQSLEMPSFDWSDILQKLRWMRNTKENPTVDGQQAAFLSSLSALPDLLDVDLRVPLFTLPWAQAVISLIQTCLNVKKFHVSTECGNYHNGLLLHEALQLLKSSDRRSDCILTLEGYQCKKTTDKCRDNGDIYRRCNKMVKITNEGESESMGYDEDSSWDGDDDSDNYDDNDYTDYEFDDYDDNDYIDYDSDWDMDLRRGLDWRTEDNPLAEPPADEDAG